ncbi:hypothetical protein PIB30_058184 [Stylosanthes scabra]|uniref:Uncharacterized protein n=1 Tax=Stylosanthes scabra TaxID=79078 RepID=A0ABU6VIE6_9FABA|nr:hypothetical protein [Stylosanthes scabra]
MPVGAAMVGEDGRIVRSVGDVVAEQGWDLLIDEINLERCEEGAGMGVVVHAAAEEELLEEMIINMADVAFNKEISNNSIMKEACEKEEGQCNEPINQYNNKGINIEGDDLSRSGPMRYKGDGPATKKPPSVRPCAMNGNIHRAQRVEVTRPSLDESEPIGSENGIGSQNGIDPQTPQTHTPSAVHENSQDKEIEEGERVV